MNFNVEYYYCNGILLVKLVKLKNFFKKIKGMIF